MRRCRVVFLFLFFCSFSPLHGQLESFGSKATFLPQKAYLYSAYVYYDLVRECGAGVQRSITSYFSMDLSLQRFYTHGILYKKILQWNYYDLSGYGISLKPKFMFGAFRNAYVGLNLSFEKLGQGITPVEYMDYYNHIPYYEYTETKGYGSTIGAVMGVKIGIRRLFLEPFFGMGCTYYKYQYITHGTTNSSHIYQGKKFPQSASGRQTFFQANLGLKFGVSFKKNKLQKAIDKRFDEVYIPRVQHLKTISDSIDPKNVLTPQSLVAGKKRLEMLNRKVIRYFNQCHTDTTWFYQKVDGRILVIDELLNKKNQ